MKVNCLDKMCIEHKIFFGISCFCILLAITFVISNQYCTTKLLAICGSEQAHQTNALVPNDAMNTYGTANDTAEVKAEKICCPSACKVLARWCGFKDSVISIDEIPVGDLDRILLPGQ